MLQLLKIEWLKVKNYKAFWIFTLLYIVSLFGINYIAWNISYSESLEAKILAPPYSFPEVWRSTAWISSWLLYLPGMLFINLYINEFNFKTHRQNIIDGWSRMNFINVKFIFAIFYSLVISIIIALNGIVFGAASGNAVSFEGFEYVFYSFLQTLGYLLFAQFLAIMFRRSGVAIIVFIMFGLIFEWLLCLLLVFKLQLGEAGYFLPLQVTDVLIPPTLLGKNLYPYPPEKTSLIIASLAYIGLYYILAMRKYKTDDL